MSIATGDKGKIVKTKELKQQSNLGFHEKEKCSKGLLVIASMATEETQTIIYIQQDLNTRSSAQGLTPKLSLQGLVLQIVKKERKELSALFQPE